MIAWHFTGEKLRNGDPIPPIGEWLEYAGDIVMCESGLHASPTPWDALQYAPGEWLHLVECEQVVEQQEDKFVCRRRKILQTRDATELLRRYAKDRALSVARLWDAPEIVLDYLRSDTEDLRDAAWCAARSAAWSATWDAAKYAVWDAVRSAARDAAWSAARDAAGSAARADFNRRALKLFGLETEEETQ